ncbi:OspG family effector kinase [Arsenophonus endosymbiont of Aleurodicus floccissimus]|uniref:OspG family effector kinase n=1 Tax=Arsenophonus endosymbiont of Aleurodicus floccissimus TaxID=2152761 RepID=UPI003F705C99
MRIYKVPEVTITSIKDKIFPLSAQERFRHMICDLGDKEIMHDDLHCNNILYNKETNRFY